MTYILGSTTLPNPKSFERIIIEKETSNVTLQNELKRNIVNRKEQFILNFINLPISTVNSIQSEYELDQVRDFSVTEDNLIILSTPVLIDITNRRYVPAGDSYRQDLTLILTEVK